MSTVVSAKQQVGINASANNNFVWRTNNDGTLRLFRGNHDAEGAEILRVNADGSIRSENQCTAWVTFVGTGTVTILDSFNVSSVTDGGVGNYTINFSEPMDSTNYSVSISTRATSSSAFIGCISQSGTLTVNAVEVVTLGLSGAAADSSKVSVVIFGGKS